MVMIYRAWTLLKLSVSQCRTPTPTSMITLDHVIFLTLTIEIVISKFMKSFDEHLQFI